MTAALRTSQPPMSDCVPVEPPIIRLEENATSFGLLSEPSKPVELSASRALTDFFDAGIEDQDHLLGVLQNKLRDGDSLLASELGRVAYGTLPRRDGRARSLAIEALAGARSPQFDDEVLGIVAGALADPSDEVQFAAIAAASDLPRTYRRSLVELMRFTSKSTTASLDVRSAATAFLFAESA